MKKLLIIGAGTAGTIMANLLKKKLNLHEWSISIVDQFETHYYQPGFLFLPFGIYDEKDVKKTKSKFIPKSVEYIQSKVELINPEENTIVLEGGSEMSYDILVIATGSKIAPEETDGLKEALWYKDIFDFYTFEGAMALRTKLDEWQGGKLLIHLTEMPIKCPVAPLEFAFLADAYFKKKGMRDKVDITYVTPLDGAFTKKIASDRLGEVFNEKSINVVTDFDISEVDNENKQLVSYDERKVDFDLLVTIPTNMGDDLIERSGLGDDLNFIPTDINTLQSKAHDNIFVVGDATDVPASKAGAVAHFEAEVLLHNIQLFIDNKPLVKDFDGHANCFIVSDYNKAFLIDFNYEQEPVPGSFPLPGIGPFKLLKSTWLNYFGKMAFRHIYWAMLLKGIPLPGIPTKMSKIGKKIPK